MRMLAVADRVFSVGYVDRAVRHHLDVPSMKDTVLLLGYHVGYARLLGVEVVAYLLHCVGLSALLHLRLPDPCPGGVPGSPGEDCSGLEVVLHVVGGELHVAVGHAHVTIIVYHPFTFGEVLYYGVPCRRECRCVKGTLAEE